MTKPSDDDSAHPGFAELAEREPDGMLWEFWLLLRNNKKYWMAPLIAVLLLLGLLILLGGTSAAPYIYALF